MESVTEGPFEWALEAWASRYLKQRLSRGVSDGFCARVSGQFPAGFKFTGSEVAGFMGRLADGFQQTQKGPPIGHHIHGFGVLFRKTTFVTNGSPKNGRWRMISTGAPRARRDAGTNSVPAKKSVLLFQTNDTDDLSLVSRTAWRVLASACWMVPVRCRPRGLRA